MYTIQKSENNKHNNTFIVISSITACIILYFIEQVIGVSYLIKTISKLFFFLTIPAFYIIWIKKSTLINSLHLKSIKGKSLLFGILYGISFMLIILLTYSILKSYIDLNKIAYELQYKLKVTPLNFIFVGTYITIGNSLLEEFFFRGYIFLNLYESGKRIEAYIFSSLLFSLYHIIIFKNWFSLPLFLLALIGLMLVGVLFDYMDTKSNNFINSWISHALADSAIIFIGLKMFKLL